VKILIIGTDDERAESLAAPLAAAGHEIVRASTPEEGIRKLDGVAPQSVIFADEEEAGRAAATGADASPGATPAGKELAAFIEKTAARTGGPTHPAKPPARPDQKTVLLLEDREVHRRRIATHLGSEGWHVIEVDNGRLGALRLIDDDPDCLLVSSVIGGKSSRGIVRSADRIRKAHPHPFAILVSLDTAHAAQVAQFVEVGADDVVSRADGAAGLLRRLEAALRLRKLMRENRRLAQRLAELEGAPV
jgi:DNA-binding response OmpR family regulator